MPRYSYRCGSCENRFDKVLPMAMGKCNQTCECGEVAERVVSEGVGGVLKGDVWVGKNVRLKKQMAERRARVGVKENNLKRDGMRMDLAPNVGGERVDSWSEASKLAKSKGLDSSTYDKKAREVKSK